MKAGCMWIRIHIVHTIMNCVVTMSGFRLVSPPESVEVYMRNSLCSTSLFETSGSSLPNDTASHPSRPESTTLL